MKLEIPYSTQKMTFSSVSPNLCYHKITFEITVFICENVQYCLLLGSDIEKMFQ